MKTVFGSRASERSRSYSSGARTLQVAEDILPIATLKAHLSDVVRSLDDRRPLIVTLNGKPAAVLMSPREFDQLTYQARVVAKVNTALADIEAGRVRDAEHVFNELDAELAPAPRRRKTTKRSRRASGLLHP